MQMRLIDFRDMLTCGSLQKNANHFDAFKPFVVTMKLDTYESIIEAFNLPSRSIESLSCVGTLFWSSLEEVNGRPYLRRSRLHLENEYF